MARALEAAHNKGVVHRDLKPDNVFLVDRDGRRDFVKIVDFGIARVLPIPGDAKVARLTRVGTVFGTPEYMAPRTSGRSRRHRPQSRYLRSRYHHVRDALRQGASQRDSTVRTLAMQMLDRVTPLSQLPLTSGVDRAVDNVVMKALEKKRDDRWQDMGLMLRAILQLSDDADTIQGAGKLPASVATLVDAPPTEVEAVPAGSVPEDHTETAEHLPSRSGLTAAPTEIYQVLTPKGEPAFVRRSRRPSMDDLIDEDPNPEPERGSKAWIVAAALAVAAAATIVIVLFAGGDRSGGGGDDSGSATSGSALATGPSNDASFNDTARVELPSDAGPGELAGSGKHPVAVKPFPNGHSAKRDRDAGLTAFGRDIEVEVITRPDGGTLWNGRDYAGAGGVVISRPHGTKLKLRCSKAGFKNGYVDVHFVGSSELVVCRMGKKTKCVKDLKNPFAKCP